jgi:hypothetical protein
MAAAAAALLALTLVLACGDSEEEFAPDPSVTPVASGTAPPVTTASPTATPTPALPPETATPSPWPVTKYVDPIDAFTFEYPSDWYISGPPLDPTPVGYSVTLFSYNPEKARQIGVPPPVEELKIDIGVEPNPEDLSAEEWVESRVAGAGEGVTVLTQESGAVAGEPAVERLISRDNSRLKEYFFAHSGKMYSISAYTADSIRMAVFERVVDSFSFTS